MLGLPQRTDRVFQDSFFEANVPQSCVASEGGVFEDKAEIQHVLHC